MAKRSVTSKDVAAAAGVSRTAVSLVLNGRADGVIQADNQERVRAAAARLGYVPNASARNLRQQSTKTIGLVTDRIASQPFAGPLLTGVTELAMARGYMLLTIDTDQHDDYFEGAARTLLERSVDGIIFAAASIREVPVPNQVRELPIALANAVDPSAAFAAFIPDDEAGEYAAATAAIERGHRRLCLITGDLDNDATHRRIAGFRRAVADAGLPTSSAQVRNALYNMVSNYAAALDVLQGPQPPTAILAANDRGAVGVHMAATQLQLTVPGDLSIIGFDDEHGFAAEVPVPITTVALPHFEMGEAAARHVLALIDGADTLTGTTVLDCPVVIRDSLAAPR